MTVLTSSDHASIPVGVDDKADAGLTMSGIDFQTLRIHMHHSDIVGASNQIVAPSSRTVRISFLTGRIQPFVCTGPGQCKIFVPIRSFLIFVGGK